MPSVTKLVLTIALTVGSVLSFSGDMTYFNPGLGACGWTNGDGDAIAALSPSKSGNCGRNIKIHYQGKSTSAKVVDKCPGCSAESIDVSPSVFEKLAPKDLGRVKVTWEFA
ncbi:hypothetical protein NUW58_g4046 [Xylaria curta]|uniref:Uncharacterized protein n=1 Tax=Xylaria curta TaxID=42375 RepID=A0ACC1P844_9PEZI|nr:hypothetical protein NUW58_g4046 [Xylaria curta]